jgi:hypothetical protein
MRQRKQIRFAELGVAGDSVLGDANKTERLGLADCRANGVSMDAILMKVSMRDRQAAIIGPAVVAKFESNPCNDAMGR